MVAISLYRGNLHKVPDVPRRWPMPPPVISVRDLRLLLRKRSQALARLSNSPTTLATTTTTDSNPNPDAAAKPHEEKEEGMGENGIDKGEIQGDGGDGGVCGEPEKGEDNEAACPLPGPKASSLDVVSNKEERTKELEKKLNILNEKKHDLVQMFKGSQASSLDIVGNQEERKRELEKKLNILNEKKHHLVQMLKQILNAEEEMKKQLSIQSSGVRGSVPLQVETTVDAGSATRNVPHRLSSEVNFGGDRGGESDDISNQNTQLRQLHHMQSTSPSAAVTLSRPTHGVFQHNPGLHTPRPSLAHIGNSQTTSNVSMGSITASPSRFAHTGHQIHATNLPTVSVSGTHLIASSPSQAASGGTSSAFKDSHLTSPL